MPLTEEDRVYVRLIRSELGQEWPAAKVRILEQLPPGLDPALIAKFVDDRPEPGIYTNKWGVEPRFYAHRDSRRLLEFYRIRTLGS